MQKNNLWYLWDGEESDPGHDDEGHGVEPAADVGQDPEGQTELDGVQHVLDHEEASQLLDGAVHFVGGLASEVVDAFRWDGHVNTYMNLTRKLSS